MSKVQLSGGILHHGDCLDVLKEYPDEYFDLIVTDPPYRISGGGKYDPEGKNPGWGWHKSILKENDGKAGFEENDILPSDYMSVLYRVLKPGRDAYIMSNQWTLEDTLREAREAGFLLHNILAWKKTNSVPNRWYRKNLEFTVYLYKKPARRIEDQSVGQLFEAAAPSSRLHPTQKPVELFEHYVLNSSEPGWKVLDPFAGSGTLGEACLRTGRSFVLIEKDRKYFEVAKKYLTEYNAAMFDVAELWSNSWGS